MQFLSDENVEININYKITDIWKLTLNKNYLGKYGKARPTGTTSKSTGIGIAETLMFMKIHKI